MEEFRVNLQGRISIDGDMLLDYLQQHGFEPWREDEENYIMLNKIDVAIFYLPKDMVKKERYYGKDC